MLNVEQITSRLAKMPDAALQQYAAMHKNDPYIMALAVSESNRRKQLRQATQGALTGGEPPKVADQALAEMAPQTLPEDQGIARLPAGDMNFADGGIVAFAGGGDVERYQYGGLTPYERDRMERLDAEARARMAAKNLPQAPYLGEGLFPDESVLGMLQRGTFPVTFPEGSIYGALQAYTANSPYSQRRIAEEKRVRAAQAAAAGSPTANDTRLPDPMSGPATSAQTYSRTMGDPGPGRRPAETTKAAPSAPTSASRTAATAAPAPAAGLGDLQTLFEGILKKQDYKDPAAARVEALGREMVAAKQRRLSEFEEDVAKRGDVFKGREERLAAREVEIGKQKDTNTGLAFLNAGLAIMSTPGGLATAIGKGARVGTEQFAAGLDKIRAAQERLGEARDKLEELRINRDDLTTKERRVLTAEIDQAKLEAEKLGIDGLRQAGQINREQAKEIFGKTVQVGVAQMENASRERVANITAGAASRGQLELLTKLGEAKPGSPLLRGFELSKQESAIPRLYEQYTKSASDPATGSEFLRRYPTFEVYLAGKGGATQPGVLPTLPGNASVRAP